MFEVIIMYAFKILALTLLLLTGCARKQSEVKFDQANYAYDNMAVPQLGKRLIFLHGLRLDHNYLVNTPGYRVVIDNLVANGWQVVLFDLPYAKPEMFADGGKTYRAAYQAKLNQAIDWAETNVGHCTVNTIGGESYGGLHALMGAAMDSRFSGYMADIPVTKIEVLKEFDGATAPSFNPLNESITARGFVSFGTNDGVVGSDNIERLVSQLPAVQINRIVGMGHEVHDLSANAQFLFNNF
jgi:pimeloyl-ACP methyl ester carboxylesterase